MSGAFLIWINIIKHSSVNIVANINMRVKIYYYLHDQPYLLTVMEKRHWRIAGGSRNSPPHFPVCTKAEEECPGISPQITAHQLQGPHVEMVCVMFASKMSGALWI
jgi:hypothetical protein